jgi:predicted Mrr-cat superfamily restriction endonuclease
MPNSKIREILRKLQLEQYPGTHEEELDAAESALLAYLDSVIGPDEHINYLSGSDEDMAGIIRNAYKHDLRQRLGISLGENTKP